MQRPQLGRRSSAVLDAGCKFLKYFLGRLMLIASRVREVVPVVVVLVVIVFQMAAVCP